MDKHEKLLKYLQKRFCIAAHIITKKYRVDDVEKFVRETANRFKVRISIVREGPIYTDENGVTRPTQIYIYEGADDKLYGLYDDDSQWVPVGEDIIMDKHEKLFEQFKTYISIGARLIAKEYQVDDVEEFVRETANRFKVRISIVREGPIYTDENGVTRPTQIYIYEGVAAELYGLYDDNSQWVPSGSDE